MYNHVININMVNYANLLFVGEYEKCASCVELNEELELLKVIFHVQ